MSNSSAKNSITISRARVEKKGGVVILSLKEYQKLAERAAPIYYLEGKEAEELDKLVEEGLREHEEGKTVRASSLKDALKKYGRKKNKKN